MYQVARYHPAGDKGILVEFGNTISKETNEKIGKMALGIEEAQLEGIGELVPTYCALMVYYDPLIWGFNQLVCQLKKIEGKLSSSYSFSPKIYLLPVSYGGEFGPDLEYVSRYNKLSPAEIVEIHTGTDYLIYMLGFTPGFPYLGGMDEKIAAPRLEIPRTVIPEGSVGIAGNQTGVYPIESPGGWRLIGRTPVRLFDPTSKEPFLLEAGNYIRFYQITAEEYRTIAHDVENNQYIVETLNFNGKGV